MNSSVQFWGLEYRTRVASPDSKEPAIPLWPNGVGPLDMHHVKKMEDIFKRCLQISKTKWLVCSFMVCGLKNPFGHARVKGCHTRQGWKPIDQLFPLLLDASSTTVRLTAATATFWWSDLKHLKASQDEVAPCAWWSLPLNFVLIPRWGCHQAEFRKLIFLAICIWVKVILYSLTGFLKIALFCLSSSNNSIVKMPGQDLCLLPKRQLVLPRGGAELLTAVTSALLTELPSRSLPHKCRSLEPAG